MTLFKKIQLRIILPVTFGNILEWYDIYSYAYFAPILARVFFDFHSPLSNLVGSFVIFGSGFLARPFGAILFGRIGDLIGRKSAFVWSIVMLTLPTFMMGCLPTYAQIGIYSPLLLASLRFLQSIPAAGETPGTICYLYENADSTNRKFMTSWTQVGNQIGAIIGLVETFLMDHFMSDEFQMSWGWRISFWVGGLFGLFGIYLRRKLDETPVYKSLKEHCRIDKESIIAVLKNHKKTIAIGTAFGVINASTFYLLATYIPTYLDKALGLSPVQNAIASLSFLLLTTILLPFFGVLGEKINIKSLLVYSSVLIIALLYPLYFAINNNSLIWIAIIGTVYVVPITLITAYMGFILAHLFPAPIRFTAVGVSFNLADGIVGGFSPAIALFLLRITNDQAAFCWFILLCAAISLVSYVLTARSFFGDDIKT